MSSDCKSKVWLKGGDGQCKDPPQNICFPNNAKTNLQQKALAELKKALGEDAISTDEEDLRMHGYSEMSSINIETLPIAVAYPKSTEEVSKIAKVCYKYKVPMSE
jgi:D-lactate dehydrogenase (cytochrome)